MSKTNTLLIRTPEGILFSQMLAGPLTRFLAWLIDFIVISGLAIVLNILVVFLVLISPDLAQALLFILYFAISIGYSMVTEWYWRGQTVGKRLLRLRVVDAEGLRLHFNQVVIRNLLRCLDLLPGIYLVGGLACLVSRRAQRLGDLAANTVVIRIPKLNEPDLQQLLAGKYNSLRGHPHLEARLRQRVSAGEAGIALQAILRRDKLTPAARVALFRQIATHLNSKVEFPQDAVEGLADEQYVRNVLDIVYRPGGAGRNPENANREPAEV